MTKPPTITLELIEAAARDVARAQLTGTGMPAALEAARQLDAAAELMKATIPAHEGEKTPQSGRR